MRVLALIAVLLACATASGAPARLAVVVGANRGVAGEPQLRFAERDATRVAEVLRDVGGVARDDEWLLSGTSAGPVRAALAEARRRAAGGAALLFYYSGHAGLDGLHLGGDVLGWDELRALTREPADAGGDLRIVLVDACHAGELARRKGFVAVPPERAGGDASHGSAVLAAAEWFEPAQESDALGGSFFTHALVSGLRGAADVDGDGLVTLAELHAFVTRDTAARTVEATGLAQHPTYRFDIAGRGDVVLARLREADARIILAEPLEGTVVVLERDSPLVVVEAAKRRGERLAFGLPKGRYIVHVRGASSVGVAEVTLPWGGEARIRPSDLTPRSLQEVALKGGIVDVRRVRLRAGVRLDTPPLAGMGLVPGIALVAGRKLDRLELALRLAAGRRSFDAADTTIDATYVEAGLVASLEWPRRLWDARAWASLDAARWWQAIRGADERAGFVPAVGAGIGARLPLGARTFAEGGIEGRASLPEVAGQGRTPRAALRAELLFGWVL